MSLDFSSIHNHHESSVFDAVIEMSPRFPTVAARHELLIDVACIALNRVQPRYIRHKVDYLFYLTEAERAANGQMIASAVQQAFEVVSARERAKPPAKIAA